MNEAANHDDIEDVLSSIRRLVSDTSHSQDAQSAEDGANRLVLTPSLRVADPEDPYVRIEPAGDVTDDDPETYSEEASGMDEAEAEAPIDDIGGRREFGLVSFTGPVPDEDSDGDGVVAFRGRHEDTAPEAETDSDPQAEDRAGADDGDEADADRDWNAAAEDAQDQNRWSDQDQTGDDEPEPEASAMDAEPPAEDDPDVDPEWRAGADPATAADDAPDHGAAEAEDTNEDTEFHSEPDAGAAAFFEREEGDTDWDDTEEVEAAQVIAAAREARGEAADPEETAYVTPVFSRAWHRDRAARDAVAETTETEARTDDSDAVADAVAEALSQGEAEDQPGATTWDDTETDAGWDADDDRRHWDMQADGGPHEDLEAGTVDDDTWVGGAEAEAEAEAHAEPTETPDQPEPDFPFEPEAFEPDHMQPDNTGPEPEAETASDAQVAARPGIADEEFEPEDAVDLSLLDEDALRDLVAQVVREELQGALGQRITRNVRKMVRREIRLALAAEDFE